MWLTLSIGLLILMANGFSAVHAQAPQFRITDVRLSDPLYVGRTTEISADVTNTGQRGLRIVAVLAEMKWVPSDTITVQPLLATLQPNQTIEVQITVHVPNNVIPTSIQYRLGLNTTIGVWYDVWRNGIVMDYWYTAYKSLHNSIQDRLTNKHYESQDANTYAQQAVDLLNQADSKYMGTEEGYNLLLQASKLIDQADLAEAKWYQNQQNMPIYILEAIGVFAVILIALGILRARDKKKRVRRHS